MRVPVAEFHGSLMGKRFFLFDGAKGVGTIPAAESAVLLQDVILEMASRLNCRTPPVMTKILKGPERTKARIRLADRSGIVKSPSVSVGRNGRGKLLMSSCGFGLSSALDCESSPHRAVSMVS